MNSTIQRRTFTATALLAVLLGSAACGSEKVTDGGTGTQPGYEARVYPPASVPPAPLGQKKGRVSADAAERQAARRRPVRTAPPPTGGHAAPRRTTRTS